MHQKERINLPVFKKDIEVPNFSKSAPDLDKTRICTPSSTNSSYNELGKSYDEGLSTISKPNCGNGDNDLIQGASTFNKNKKYSLDSNIENNNSSLTNRQLKLSHSFDEEGSMGYNKNVYNNNENLTYDRVFHKKMQKSLEMLSTYVNSSSQDDEDHKTYWKSSDNLSSGMKFGYFEGESQFPREQFFTNSNLTNDTSSSYNSILKSTHLPPNSHIRQENGNIDSISSRIRKTSVTFNNKSFEEYSNYSMKSSGSLSFNSQDDKVKKNPSFYKKFSTRSHNSQIDKQKSKLKTPDFFHKIKNKFNYSKNKITYKDSNYHNDKTSRSDINEKLLETDPINAENNDSPYETVYYSKNYVIARNKN